MGDWETGHSVPRLFKLINISAYFDVSLDCLLNGKTAGENILENRLHQIEKADTFELAEARGVGRFMYRFNSLSAGGKDRLTGYLDALYRGN